MSNFLRTSNQKFAALERVSKGSFQIGIPFHELPSYYNTRLSRILCLHSASSCINDCLEDIHSGEIHELANTCWHLDTLDIFLYRWETGEYVFLPMIDNSFLLHPTQNYWLKYYQFLKSGTNNLVTEEIDGSGALFLGGRDSFGHLLQDFLPRAILASVTLKCNKLLFVPIERFLSLIDSIMDETGQNVTHMYLPHIAKGSAKIFRLHNIKYIDWCSPSMHYWLSVNYLRVLRKQSNRSHSCSFLSFVEPKRFFWDLPSNNQLRLANSHQICDYLSRTGLGMFLDLSKFRWKDRVTLLKQFRVSVFLSGSAWHNVFFTSDEQVTLNILSPNVIASENPACYHQLYILSMSDIVRGITLRVGYPANSTDIYSEIDDADPNTPWRSPYRIEPESIINSILEF